MKLDILSKRGQWILKIIQNAAKNNGLEEGDILEMTMLANSFDLYFSSAEYIQENGVKQVFENEKGSYSQIAPEYTVMVKEYQAILKHSGKFGLNPADRKRIFAKAQKKEAPFG